VHHDSALNHCISNLRRSLGSADATYNIETLSLVAIAIKAAEGGANPFEVVISYE
jgi:hypothetical protein